MARLSLIACSALGFVLLRVPAARAQQDPEALSQLKRGYALKQEGDCVGAVPHFERSVRLQPSPKAWLNLSDCEQLMGDLIAAREHATLGRRLAEEQRDRELTAVAEEQIAGIDKRVGWLAVRLAPGAPSDCSITRDGAAVEHASLGLPSAVNPGHHSVSVAAPGHRARVFEVTVAEGGRVELDVAPGERVRRPPPLIPIYTTLTVGAIGVALGLSTGLAAVSKHDALAGECPGDSCTSPTGKTDLDAFRTLRAWSTVGYAVGAAGLVGAGALWLVWTQTSSPSGVHARVAPGSIWVEGTF